MNQLLSIFLCFMVPALLLYLSKKKFLIGYLGPVVSCYLVGILIGNTTGQFFDAKLAQRLTEVSILFALPLLLLSVDVRGWLKLAPSTILSFSLLIVSVMFVSLCVGFFFKDSRPDVWKMAGMLVGVYVGGTANLVAIGKILNVGEDVFVMLNGVDLIWGGIYLLFILTSGVKILGLLLPPFNFNFYSNPHHLHNSSQEFSSSWKELSFTKKILHSFLSLFLGTFIVAVSLGVSFLFFGEILPGVVFFILSFLSVGLSFKKKIRHFQGHGEWGNYFLLVFCFSVGSLARVADLMEGSLWYFIFCGLIMVGSIVLHFLCCFFLKIDRDTAIITSVAGIFGPAFVAPVGKVLTNKNILLSGVSCGLFGIGIGNFVGLAVAYLLRMAAGH